MLPMPAPSRQTGVSDGPLYFLSARRIPRLRARVTFGRSGPLHRLSLCLRRPLFFQQRKGKVPRFRARVTFGRSPKSDQKRCLKPQVSRLPARLGYVKNLSPRTPRKPKCCTSSYNESLTILLSLPLPRSTRQCAAPLLRNGGFCDASWFFILFVMPPRVAPPRLVDISVRLLMFSNLLTAPLPLP